MTPQQDTAIRRRPDGSIDVDFYTRRAALLRCATQKKELARWARQLGRAIAKLAAAHLPHTRGAGPTPPHRVR